MRIAQKFVEGNILGDNNIKFIKEVEHHYYPDGRRTRCALFECSCGKRWITRINHVKNNHIKSCGCKRKLSFKKEYKIGDKIEGSLVTYISEAGYSISSAGNKNRRGKFRCHCGNEFESGFNAIRSGDIKGCGCLHGSYDWVKQANSVENPDPQLYIIECSKGEEYFIKIGITYKSVEERFRYYFPYSYKILDVIRDSAENIRNLEQLYHKAFRNYSYVPEYPFDGMGECYTVDLLNDEEYGKCD